MTCDRLDRRVERGENRTPLPHLPTYGASPTRGAVMPSSERNALYPQVKAQ